MSLKKQVETEDIMTSKSFAAELEQAIHHALPLVKAIDVRLEEVQKGKIKASMSRNPLIVNHIDAFHAGALYTFAESAAGAAIAATFNLGELTLINKRGEIKYKKLVTEKIESEISFSKEQVGSILNTIEKEGKAVFPLEVLLKNPDGEIASEVTFDFYLRKNKS